MPNTGWTLTILDSKTISHKSFIGFDESMGFSNDFKMYFLEISLENNHAMEILINHINLLSGHLYIPCYAIYYQQQVALNNESYET